jgi:radical SAM superfamily enzyme YgiQ (UPF0313 family)
MRSEEALARVNAVVTGEAESVWARVLDDVSRGALQPLYAGAHTDMSNTPPARHDLLTGDYDFGSIQTTRGCPLNCSFCSVTAFNGFKYRQRPVPEVVREFAAIREKRVLVVDDNLIGISRDHIARTKDLFRAMIQAKLNKVWIAQVTINFADDEELLALAALAGCAGVFVGFESPTLEGLQEIGKKFNMQKGRDLAASVRKIQRHKILVAGSFIMGLDTDKPGIGARIAEAAAHYGVDFLNALYLTPLPGTRLWDELEAHGRIAADRFPEDWRYYTLSFPVARYRHFSPADIVREMTVCDDAFYSWRHILRRAWSGMVRGRRPLIGLVGNLSYRKNARSGRKPCWDFLHSRAQSQTDARRSAEPDQPSEMREYARGAASP